MDRTDDPRLLSRHTPLFLGLLALLAITGCIRPNEEHCLFSGGDFGTTEASQICVIPVEADRGALAVDEHGWYELPGGMSPTTFTTLADAGLPAGYLWVPFGLPTTFKGGTSDVRTVRGVADAALRVRCEGSPLLGDAELDGPWGAHLESYAIDTLDRKTLLRLASAAPMKGDLEEFSDELLALIISCDVSDTDTDLDTSSGTLDTDTSSETETTASTTGEEPCTNDAMCSGETPFCELDSGECVTCDGMTDPHAACASLDMGTTVCLGGICVECTAEMPDACTGVPPLCDDAMNACVPCTAHEQCGEAACNLFTGACLPADAVVRVGPGQRFTTLTSAVASFAEGAEGTIIVEAGTYDESLTVGGGRVLAFLAAELGPGIDPPRWVRTAGNAPQLTVSADGTVLMDGMQVSTNISTSQPGVRLNGGRAWLDRAQVVANPGGGIVADSSAELVLRNCFVGGDVNDRIALEVTGAMATLVYTTIATGFGASSALACDATATVNVRSSLLVSRSTDDEVACAGADIQHSAAESDLGATNIALGPVSTTWFVDYAAGDFHLALPHPAAIDTAAQWQAGHPPTDIDGEPRPTDIDAPDHAGADVP